MKRNLLSILALLAFAFSYSQTTFEVQWDQTVGANATFTIETGDSVKWIWANGVPHSVRSTGGTETFNSGIISGMGTEFTFTFNNEGSTSYDCEVHPASMQGTITVTPILSVEEKFRKNVSFFPNPVNEELTIASLYQLDNYEIYDMTGKKVGWGEGQGNFTRLNTSYLNSGLYLVKVFSGELKATLKLIKK
jgi:plastocyanin